MSRRWLFLFAIVAVFVFVAGGTLALRLLQQRTAITPESVQLVALGMTRAEVESILGGPAREELGGYTGDVGHLFADGLPPDVWAGPDAIIGVWFDFDTRTRVAAIRLSCNDPHPPEGVLETICRWLGLS